MSAEKVQATIQVQSENFNQSLEEPIADSSATDQTSSYETLIAANERLKINISKIFTEFVNKARLEQQTSGGETKRKLKHDDNDEEDEDADGNDEEEEDAELSDNHDEE